MLPGGIVLTGGIVLPGGNVEKGGAEGVVVLGAEGPATGAVVGAPQFPATIVYLNIYKS